MCSAPAWLASALLGGNAVALFDTTGLDPTLQALQRAGVPDSALGVASGAVVDPNPPEPVIAGLTGVPPELVSP